jgi:uncharacterized protein (TIGR02145 family)
MRVILLLIAPVLSIFVHSYEFKVGNAVGLIDNMQFNLERLGINAILAEETYNFFTSLNRDSLEKPITEAGNNDICVDESGRKYRTVQIGEQLWMAENLAYQPDNGNYWAYADNPSNIEVYGYLYDYQTAKRVCPKGWHLPTEMEWNKLVENLGGGEIAGRKMISGAVWNPNCKNCEIGTNESGFSALPSGCRNISGWGGYSYTGGDSFWWSSTEKDRIYAQYCFLGYGHSIDGRVKPLTYSETDFKTSGYSVRCVCD